MSDAHPRSKRRWIIALLVSLALNLLLVGFIGGRALQPSPPPPGGDPNLGLLRWAQELPESRRAELKPSLRDYHRSLKHNRKSLRQHHLAVRRALRADEFQAQPLIEALNKRQNAVNERRLDSHASFVDLLSQLTVQERKALDRYMRKRARAERMHHRSARPSVRPSEPH